MSQSLTSESRRRLATVLPTPLLNLPSIAPPYFAASLTDVNDDVVHEPLAIIAGDSRSELDRRTPNARGSEATICIVYPRFDTVSH